MNPLWILVPIFFPIIFGALLPVFRFQTRGARQTYVGAVVLLNTLLAFLVLCADTGEGLRLFSLGGTLEIAFRIDGLSRVFAGLVAALWPLASLYAFSYMKHEGRETTFFAFYTMTFGVTLGIAFSKNLMTLYMFYELLTLVTLPLVLHSMKKESVRAGRTYVFYSIGGAAFAFIGFIFILNYGQSITFSYGGVLNTAQIAEQGTESLLRVVYLFTVLGFGVKAAIFPFHGWLPRAAVAPTPVTALLHAVAVVKAGAFAILRVTYFSFGTEFLRGSFAQYILLIMAMLTILYGSITAVREHHFKRRLAYSTISNLSYIVLGAALMTPAGLTGALLHMVFHGVMKIGLFFCAGAVMVRTGKEYVDELAGYGRKMPFTFGCFAVCGASLAGIPMLSGFVSKWQLATAAVSAGAEATGLGAVLPVVGVAVLLISAFLTAIYVFPLIVRAFFPGKGVAPAGSGSDPDWCMKLPIGIFAAATVALGLLATPLTEFMSRIAAGGL